MRSDLLLAVDSESEKLSMKKVALLQNILTRSCQKIFSRLERSWQIAFARIQKVNWRRQ